MPDMSERRLLRVITFNVAWHLPWDDRAREIERWLAVLQPDVLLLQENVDDRAVEIASFVGGHAAIGTNHGALRYVNAVVSRWPIEEQQSIVMPMPVPDPQLNRGTEPIGADALHVRTNGMDFVSAHLAPPPKEGAIRVQQALALDDACREIGEANTAFPVVMGGDFNADPDSDEVRFLCGAATIGDRSTRYQEAWRDHGIGPGWTLDRRNPFHSRTPVPNRHVDYLFVGDPFYFSSYFGGPGQLTGMTSAASVVFNEPLTGTFASDHFGVMADICLPPT
jgi:endonuclease/exonuclease/phosphatase family metal-dependent hydrolase